MFAAREGAVSSISALAENARLVPIRESVSAATKWPWVSRLATSRLSQGFTGMFPVTESPLACVSFEGSP